jgi:cysteine synthase A
MQYRPWAIDEFSLIEKNRARRKSLMKQSPVLPLASALDAIGNTPVVRLRRVVPEGCASVYVKLEYFNPTGSYKDRMAKTMIEEAEARGTLKPGMTVVEASGGSTGSSLAFVCAVKGYRFHIVSSNAFAPEKLRTMAAFGAEVELIHSPSGKISANLIPSMIQRSKQIAAQGNFYTTDQFNNRDSLLGYEQIGVELVKQFPKGISVFCGAVGVAGMVMGVSRAFKAADRSTRIVVLEPATSPVISLDRAGEHHVEGIGIGFVPPLLDCELYDEVRAISEEEGRQMCRRLAAEEGLLVGTSTGLNVTAAIQLARELGPEATVVTVASDTGLKYMNGNLFAAPSV